MTALKNPGLTGTFTFDTLIYASSGLNYSAVPALSQYQIYDSPHPSYVTGRIDISAFAQLGASVPVFVPSATAGPEHVPAHDVRPSRGQYSDFGGVGLGLLEHPAVQPVTSLPNGLVHALPRAGGEPIDGDGDTARHWRERSG